MTGYEWSDGSAANYFNWNQNIESEAETICSFVAESGHWHHSLCNETIGFVCQVPRPQKNCLQGHGHLRSLEKGSFPVKNSSLFSRLCFFSFFDRLLDELEKVYAPEINMFSCMDDGNCWNGQASIGERCYYPIGYGPDDDPSNESIKISVDFIMIVLTFIFTSIPQRLRLPFF